MFALARRHPARTCLVVLLLVLLVWGSLGFIKLLQIRADADQLSSDLADMERTVRAAVDGEGSAPSIVDVRDDLLDVQNRAGRLARELDSTQLMLLDRTPLVSRQIESARRLSTLLERLAASGASLATRADFLAGSKSNSRVELLEDMASELRDVSSVATSDLGPSSKLLPPLARARHRAADLLEDFGREADEAGEVLAGVADFLEGPSDFLLLSSNNTAMGGFGGRYLEQGWLRARDGKVRSPGTVQHVFVPPGEVEMADRDWQRNWGWLVPSSFIATLPSTPRFDVQAPQAAAMWSAHTGEPVNGVLMVDIEAVCAMVEATGPIRMAGKSYEADALRRYLIRDQYLESDREARKDDIGKVSARVLSRVTEARDPLALIRAFRSAIAGRHLMVWSEDGGQQDAWQALGAAGTIGSNSVMVGTSYLYNKLDPYLDITATPTARRGPRGTIVDLAIEVTNTATLAEPELLLQTEAAERFSRPAGSYVGILAVELPEASSRVATTGKPTALGPDGDAYQVSTLLEVEVGASVTTVISFQLDGDATLHVEPSSRLRPTIWGSSYLRWG